MREIFNKTDMIELEKVKNKLNPHLFSVLNVPQKLNISKVPALNLVLNPKRFDILIKYIYAKYYNKAGYEWTKDLYLEHIKIINNFKEADLLKSGADNFLDNFNKLIESIRKDGFDEANNIIPISVSGVVTDGAHRVAASAVMGLSIPVVRVEANHCFDYSYFKQKGLSVKYLDFVLLEYFKMNPNAYIINIFPKYNDRISEVENLLKKQSPIYAKKEIIVTENAPAFLTRNYYEFAPWLGTLEDNFKGSFSTGKQRFHKTPTSFNVYVYECSSLEKILKLKNDIRSILDDDPYSVHINDDQPEAIRLAKTYFNENSLDFINTAELEAFNNFHPLFENFKKWLKTNDLDYDNYCVDSSGVMSAYGIREKYYSYSILEILFNPSYHFYYDGIKFTSIEVLKQMKHKRGEEKDKEDLLLINNFFNQRSLFYAYRKKWNFRKLSNQYKSKVKNILLKVPKMIYRKTKSTYRHSLYSVYNLGNKNEKILRYHGYELFHTKGTSIVNRYLNTNAYEPELSNSIVKELLKKSNPTLLDVGANIGMISLFCLSKIPTLNIFAFEPGPLQHGLLEKTIQANQLQDSITLNNKALSNETGVASFAIHQDEHNSGDGFVDTGRAGNTTTISVQTKRIDEWWQEQGQPNIDVIKIDTEGAEFLVLTGAKKMIKTLKPVLYLEIYYHNLKNYPHSEDDIYELLEELGYKLFLLSGRMINKQDLIKLSLRVSEYVAIYETQI